jgi:hypothetical protein
MLEQHGLVRRGAEMEFLSLPNVYFEMGGGRGSGRVARRVHPSQQRDRARRTAGGGAPTCSLANDC